MKITVLAAVLLLLALRSSTNNVMYLQLAACLLGSFAAVTFTALGGAAIPPGLMLVPVVFWRTVREQGGVSAVFARLPRSVVWLLALAVWGAVGAVVLPRMFAGDIMVMKPTRGEGVTLVKLVPSSGNITQTAYAIGNVVVFLAFRGLIVSKQRLVIAKKAVLLLAGLMVGAGLLNLAEYHLHLPSILESTRTMAGVNDMYAASGFVRIQGTFAEASAYATSMVPLFAFSLNLWIHDRTERVAAVIAIIGALLLVISTSGTAYASLCLYLPLFALRLSPRLLNFSRWPVPIATLAGMVVTLVGLMILAWTLELGFTKSIDELLERTFFGKIDSDSGEERGSWNMAAIMAFLHSYGFGVGLGSTYASSYALVIASNLGLPGIIIYGGFLLSVYRRLKNPQAVEASPVLAARQCLLVNLIASSISGTVFNIGPQIYIYAAIASIEPEHLASAPVQVRKHAAA